MCRFHEVRVREKERERQAKLRWGLVNSEVVVVISVSNPPKKEGASYYEVNEGVSECDKRMGEL